MGRKALFVAALGSFTSCICVAEIVVQTNVRLVIYMKVASINDGETMRHVDDGMEQLRIGPSWPVM